MSEVREIRNERLSESYFEIDHASGLKILVYPKRNYASSYAVFGTRYGSIDTAFRLKGEKKFTEVPAGIAHFLEHKLFESEELDAFQRFAETGANANAYTSFDRTCYLFGCTGNFEASLEILLDFVTHPYFTPETVRKEQGIIGQEIQMCRDEPSWEVLFGLLRAMYHEHPVHMDIAGTPKSIAGITSELLYKCYDTFYGLGNMVLCTAGNTDCETVLSVADRVLEKRPRKEIERKFHREPPGVFEAYAERRLPVSAPVFMAGFKEDVETPERSLKEMVCSDILLELIAGRTSPLYTRLLDEKLINSVFDFEFFTGYGYAASLFSGESRDPEAVRDRLLEEVRRFRAEGVREADFERIRRKLYGRIVFGFNDVGELANGMADAYFTGRDIFSEAEALSRLTKQDVTERLERSLDPDNLALCIVKEE